VARRGLGKLFRRHTEDPPESLRRQAETPEPVRPQTLDLALRDHETGLPTRVELDIVMRREMARAARYGGMSCLVLFDIRVASYQPTSDRPESPSPAKFVAAQLLDTAREADVVARVSKTRFAVLLIECDEPGASNFAQRTRTRISTESYARTADDLPIFVRSWAGCVNWRAEYADPEAYFAAAQKKLEVSFIGYEADQSYFLAD